MIKLIVDDMIFYLSQTSLEKYKNFDLDKFSFVKKIESHNINTYIVDTDPDNFKLIIKLIRGINIDITPSLVDDIKKFNLFELLPSNKNTQNEINSNININNLNINNSDDNFTSLQSDEDESDLPNYSVISVENDNNIEYDTERINNFNKLFASDKDTSIIINTDDLSAMPDKVNIINKNNITEKKSFKPRKIEFNLNNA